MKRFIFCAVVLSLVLPLAAPAANNKENPNMEKAVEFLKTALAASKSATAPRDPATQTAKTAALQTARDYLQKAPGMYKGRRVNAMQFIDAALGELKEGDTKKKCDSYIRKAISEIKDGVHQPNRR